MTRAQLIAQIQAKKSVLCVGLDPDMDKMPAHFPRTAEGLADLCCAIIDATALYAVAYKPNLAFFEALGVAGWQALARVADHLRRYPPSFEHRRRQAWRYRQYRDEIRPGHLE